MLLIIIFIFHIAALRCAVAVNSIIVTLSVEMLGKDTI